MTDDPFAYPVERIRAAVAAREGALACWRHSPNHETARVLSAAHKTLDYRLEQLWASLDDDVRAGVEQREIRQAVTV